LSCRRSKGEPHTDKSSSAYLGDTVTENKRPIIAINTLSVPGARLGGGFTYLHNLLPRLIAAAPRARFHLLVTEANHRFFPPADNDVRVTRLSNLCLRGSVRTIVDRCRINSWLRQIRADLYFVPYGWLPKNPPCPTVWTFQNLLLLASSNEPWTQPAGRFQMLRHRLRGWAISHVLLAETIKADRIIAVSQTAQRELLREYPQCQNRVTVVYEGVTDRFGPTGRQSADQVVLSRLGLVEPYYLSVSTLMPNKNFGSLIRAFAEFKHRSGAPDVLAIAGDDWGGHKSQLEQVVEEVTAREFIRFLGHVDPADLPALYRSARSFVLLSTCESFGLPALEAMASGCPTVVANTSGLAEIVGDGGLQVRPDDSEKLACTLKELHESAEKRSALGRAGLARAAQFSWPTTAKQTVAVFETLLGQSISARHQASRSHAAPINSSCLGRKGKSNAAGIVISESCRTNGV